VLDDLPDLGGVGEFAQAVQLVVVRTALDDRDRGLLALENDRRDGQDALDLTRPGQIVDPR
jgi:hypothetical protein